MKVLIISNGSATLLKETAKAKKIDVEVIKPSELYLYISQFENGYDRVYRGNEDTTDPYRINLKEVDAIIPRISGQGFEFGCAVVGHFEKCLGIYSTGSALGLRMASDKFWCSQEFSDAGLPQPKTVFADTPRHVDFLMKKVDGLPVVGKLPRGSQGKQVFILESPQAANTTLQTFFSTGQDVIIQEFIETGAKDIRAIVVGDKVVSAMERSGKKDFRANLSQGGAGRNVLNELTEKEKELCIKAARSVKLDFAGIDFVRDSKGNALFIEANGNPGEKIITVTGHNHYADLLDLIVSRSRKASSGSSIGSSAGNGQTADNKASGEPKSREEMEVTKALSKAKAGSPLSVQEMAILAVHEKTLI